VVTMDENPGPGAGDIDPSAFSLEDVKLTVEDLATPRGRFRGVLGVIWRSTRRLAVTLVGFALLLLGVAMIVLPGPGLLVIIAGLAVLATEYIWARRLLMAAKARAEAAKTKLLRKPKPDDNK